MNTEDSRYIANEDGPRDTRFFRDTGVFIEAVYDEGSLFISSKSPETEKIKFTEITRDHFKRMGLVLAELPN